MATAQQSRYSQWMSCQSPFSNFGTNYHHPSFRRPIRPLTSFSASLSYTYTSHNSALSRPSQGSGSGSGSQISISISIALFFTNSSGMIGFTSVHTCLPTLFPCFQVVLPWIKHQRRAVRETKSSGRQKHIIAQVVHSYIHILHLTHIPFCILKH